MTDMVKIMIFSIICVILDVVIKWEWNANAAVLDVGPKLCLLATSTFFVLTLTDRKLVIAQITHKLRTVRAQMNSQQVIELINNIEPQPRFNILFVLSFGFWVLCEVLSAKGISMCSAEGFWSNAVFYRFCITLILGVAAIIAALYSAKEATQK